MPPDPASLGMLTICSPCAIPNCGSWFGIWQGFPPPSAPLCWSMCPDQPWPRLQPERVLAWRAAPRGGDCADHESRGRGLDEERRRVPLQPQVRLRPDRCRRHGAESESLEERRPAEELPRAVQPDTTVSWISRAEDWMRRGEGWHCWWDD